MLAPTFAPPTVCDALSVLAHLYLRFGRAASAAALLAALAQVDENPSWARRTRCLALLRAGRPEAALTEALALLDHPLDDAERGALQLVMAQACWRLGREDEAREHFAQSRIAAVATVLRPTQRRGGLHP